MKTRTRPPAAPQSRRRFLGTLALGAPFIWVPRAGAAESARRLPQTGTMDSGLEEFEAVLFELLDEGEVPAAQFCVSKDGKIVFNRAYGWLDQAARKPLPCQARIGLASVDKVITSSAIDMLCRQRAPIPNAREVVSRELRPFVIFRQLGLAPGGRTLDERLLRITVRDLLDHKGALNEEVHQALVVQRALRLQRLATPRDSISYFFTVPLTREPGVESHYNSAGYFVLRFLIDLAGGGFILYLQKNIFGPAGTSEICLSRARPALRDPLEVRYQSATRGPSIFPEDRGASIPENDGGNGRYVDNHLVLATSATALVLYMNYWFFGSADRLWTTNPAQLTPGLNNGAGLFSGGMIGIRTGIFQRRWTMCNYAILTNWVRDRPGIKPQDFHKRFEKMLEKRRW